MGTLSECSQRSRRFAVRVYPLARKGHQSFALESGRSL